MAHYHSVKPKYIKQSQFRRLFLMKKKYFLNSAISSRETTNNLSYREQGMRATQQNEHDQKSAKLITDDDSWSTYNYN